jgi:outer membrane protein OmpA-like peptidoglycan-associated protein
MKHHDNEEGEHWLSVSDMMSGLMVIFLFIAISYMLEVTKEKDKIVEVAVSYEKHKDMIYWRLMVEFEKDLAKWNAEIDRENLVIRFKEPDVLFDIGKAEIKPQFKAILDDFFPRYIKKVLEDYKHEIEEIRIEGHTSSDWAGDYYSKEESYFKNMALSQERTRATLEYCLSLPQISENREWIKSVLTANGLSSSKLIYKTDKTEDAARSRRVEFRIRTNAEQQMVKILKSQ